MFDLLRTSIGLFDVTDIQHSGNTDFAHHLPFIQSAHTLHRNADAVHNRHIAINGESTNNIVMSDDIAPYSTGKAIARCNDFKAIYEAWG